MVTCGEFDRGGDQNQNLHWYPSPINLVRELDRQEKSKSSRGILKSKGFESWIRESSSFSICFEFIVTNEEASYGLSEHVWPEGSLDISITQVSRDSLQVNPFTVKYLQVSSSEEGETCYLDHQILFIHVTGGSSCGQSWKSQHQPILLIMS